MEAKDEPLPSQDPPTYSATSPLSPFPQDSPTPSYPEPSPFSTPYPQISPLSPFSPFITSGSASEKASPSPSPSPFPSPSPSSPPAQFLSIIPRFPITSPFPLSFPPGALYLPLSPETRPTLQIWEKGEKAPHPPETFPLQPPSQSPSPLPPSPFFPFFFPLVSAFFRLLFIALLPAGIILIGSSLRQEDLSLPFLAKIPLILGIGCTLLGGFFLLFFFFVARGSLKDHCLKNVSSSRVFDEARSAAPLIKMEIECFHYAPIGKRSRRKIVTKRQSHTFHYTSSTDFSPSPSSLLLLEKTPLLQLQTSPLLFFEDQYTKSCFEAEEQAFLQFHRSLDEHFSYSLSLSLPGFEKKSLVVMREEEEELQRRRRRRPFLFGMGWAVFFKVLGLEMLFERWLASRAPLLVYPVKKAIGRRFPPSPSPPSPLPQ